MNSEAQHRMSTDQAVSVSIEDRTIARYGVVFESDSYPLIIEGDNGQEIRVVEQIRMSSIEGADLSDMICSFNHNFEKILGRSSNDTLKLEIDETGIKYTVQVGRTSYGDDVLSNVQRGDVEGSSFVFLYDLNEGYDISQRADGTVVGVPRKITKIIEMGPVTSPAYPGTIENRSGDFAKAVKRFLKKKEEVKEAVQTEQAESRALDVIDKMNIVTAAFYEAFDGKDNKWYYVQSMDVEDNLVVKQYPDNLLYKLSFEMSENNEVTFQDQESWVQVQKEYVPVTEARSFYEALEAERRDKQETKIQYPNIDRYKNRARVYRAKRV